MNNFTKAFIRTATRYAEYIEVKILKSAKIKGPCTEQPLDLGPGQVIDLDPPEFEEELRKEMQTMIKTAELLVAARHQKEQKNTPRQEENLIRYYLSYNEDTDDLEITPGSKGCIQLHGKRDIEWFIDEIRNTFNENMGKNKGEKDKEDGRNSP
ncbi:MAG: hypothetical protein NC307_15545 [Roseburia sp.]|nr:hypothetical protein [Roseburia sp.]